jgi:S-adenosylmethionine synthetase
MKIKSIKRIEKEETWDLSIKDNHNYFVGKSEINVHNSGKDPSKVDRSAAYMARHIAKSLVANNYANKALVQLSYAIGYTKPFSISVDSDSSLPEEILVKLIQENFDLSPKGIIEYLKLNDQTAVKYRYIAGGGHFLSSSAPWEEIKKF